MNSRDAKSIWARQHGMLCFLFSLLFLVAAAWLFARGDFPSIPVGSHTYITFGAASINGHELPDWVFYFLPGSMCAISICLLFAGWRRVRSRQSRKLSTSDGGNL